MENIVKKKTAKQLFVVSAVMLATCGSFYGMNFEEGPEKKPENEVVIDVNHANEEKDIIVEGGNFKYQKIHVDYKKNSICAMCCCCDSCDENKVHSSQSSFKEEPINIKFSPI